MKNSSQDSVSNELRKVQTLVIARWEEKVREKIKSLDQHSSLILRDHLPEMLDELEDVLRLGCLERQETGKAHGFQRAIMTDATLKVVMDEYAFLREAIIHYLYPLGDRELAKLIHRFLDHHCRDSVIEYLRHCELRESKLSNPPIDTLGQNF